MQPLQLSSGSRTTALGASELAHRVAVGELTASDVVEDHIRRIEAVNPAINALVVPLFDQARTAARAADQARSRGHLLGPLHGVGRLRVAVYADDGYFTPSPAVRRAVWEAAEVVRRCGGAVDGFRPPDVAEAARIYFGLFYADGLLAMRRCSAGGRRDWRVRRIMAFASLPTIMRPWFAWLLEATGQAYAGQILRFVPKSRLLPTEYGRLVKEEASYRDRFMRALDAGRFDAILCPPSGSSKRTVISHRADRTAVSAAGWGEKAAALPRGRHVAPGTTRG